MAVRILVLLLALIGHIFKCWCLTACSGYCTTSIVLSTSKAVDADCISLFSSEPTVISLTYNSISHGCYLYSINCCVSDLQPPGTNQNDITFVRRYDCRGYCNSQLLDTSTTADQPTCDFTCKSPCRSFSYEGTTCSRYSVDCCNDPSWTASATSVTVQLTPVNLRCLATFFNLTTGIVAGGPYMAGQTYTFTCQPHFRVINTVADQSKTYQCSVDGLWTEPFVGCEGVVCATNFFDGSTTGMPQSSPPYYFRTLYNFTCVNNYVSGYETFAQYLCDSSGQWVPNVLNPCKPTCPAVSMIVGAIVDSSQSDANNSLGRPLVSSQLRFSCSPNMTMKFNKSPSGMKLANSWGPHSITCLSTGEWDYPIPHCSDPVAKIVGLTVCDPNIEGQQCPAFCSANNTAKLFGAIDATAKLRPIDTATDMPAGSTLRKVAGAVSTLGCSAMVIMLSIALGIALLTRSFRSSLQLANLLTLIALLFSYALLMPVIDKEGILLQFLNSGGCSLFAYLLQFFFLCCFLLKVLKAIELLGIFGHILTNTNMVSRTVVALVALLLPSTFSLASYLVSGDTISTDKSCFLNLSAHPFGWLTILFGLLASWLSLIILESAGCVTFRPLLLKRAESKAEMINLWYLRYLLLLEIPITFLAWVVNIFAQFTQQFAFAPVAFGLNICVGVISLQSQLGAAVEVKEIAEKMGILCRRKKHSKVGPVTIHPAFIYTR